MSEDSSSHDKMRICPTCRMEISFFATKCRFCGEAVGRPRDEARKLTVHDLGGISPSDYAPSEDVMDAIEAFRREEIESKATDDLEPGGFFWRRRARHKSKKTASSFDDLDPRSRELADIGMQHRYSKARRQPIWTRQLAMGAGFVAAVVLLYFGGIKVKAGVEEYLARRNAKPQVMVDNRAISILESGSYLSALEEAMRCIRVADTPANQRIAETVRLGVANYLRGRLNSDNWSDSVMRQVEDETNKATTIDPYSPLLRDVKKEVREEVRMHSITFTNPDPNAGTVTLHLLNEPKPLEMVRIGYRVHGRFELMNITSEHIRFKDHARNTSKGIPRQFVLDKFGSFTSS